MTNSVITKPLEINSLINSSFFYNTVIVGDEIKVINSETINMVHNIMMKTSEAVYKMPIYLQEEINADEWKKSLQYSDDEIKVLYEKILFEFDIEINNQNIELLEKMIYDRIDINAKEFNRQLKPETRMMLRNLITKMTYDKFCVKLDVK